MQSLIRQKMYLKVFSCIMIFMMVFQNMIANMISLATTGQTSEVEEVEASGLVCPAFAITSATINSNATATIAGTCTNVVSGMIGIVSLDVALGANSNNVPCINGVYSTTMSTLGLVGAQTVSVFPKTSVSCNCVAKTTQISCGPVYNQYTCQANGFFGPSTTVYQPEPINCNQNMKSLETCTSTNANLGGTQCSPIPTPTCITGSITINPNHAFLSGTNVITGSYIGEYSSIVVMGKTSTLDIINKTRSISISLQYQDYDLTIVGTPLNASRCSINTTTKITVIQPKFYYQCQVPQGSTTGYLMPVTTVTNALFCPTPLNTMSIGQNCLSYTQLATPQICYIPPVTQTCTKAITFSNTGWKDLGNGNIEVYGIITGQYEPNTVTIDGNIVIPDANGRISKIFIATPGKTLTFILSAQPKQGTSCLAASTTVTHICAVQPPLCIVQTGDITITNLVSTTGAVKANGYCNSSKIMEITYELYTATNQLVATQTGSCINNAWSYTTQGLQANTIYTLSVKNSLNQKTCGGITKETQSFTTPAIITPPTCTNQLTVSDYTYKITTTSTTATIFGSYDISKIASGVIIYNGMTYTGVFVNGQYSITLPVSAVGSQNATLTFFPTNNLCVSIPQNISFTCSTISNPMCQFKVNDFMTNYASGAVVYTSAINLTISNIDANGGATIYSVNGTTGTIQNGSTFTQPVSLISGKNTFDITVFSKDNLTSCNLTKTIIINYVPPVVNPVCNLMFTTLTPSVGFTTTESTFLIQGMVNASTGKVIVKPTGAELPISTGGAFSGLFSLNPGTTTDFTITAKNIDGCEVSKIITMTRPSTSTNGGGGGGTIYVGGSNICGDKIVRTSEQCDDGNYINGDGCDSNCRLEYVTKSSTGTTVTKTTTPALITKKIISKKIVTKKTTTNTALSLGTIIAPVVLPKTGTKDFFAYILQVIIAMSQSMIV